MKKNNIFSSKPVQLFICYVGLSKYGPHNSWVYVIERVHFGKLCWVWFCLCLFGLFQPKESYRKIWGLEWNAELSS